MEGALPASLKTIGLGGWTLDAHHNYDPIGRLLQLGDGSRRRTQSAGRVVETVLKPESDFDSLDQHLTLAALDLETLVDLGSIEFLGSYLCGVAATALVSGGGSVATARARAAAAAQRAANPAKGAGQGIAREPKPSVLQVQS